jgi:hypothetical protein
MTPPPTNVGAPAGSTIPGQKKGGKVKKYADGGDIDMDSIKEAIKSGKAVDRMPTPGRNNGTNPALSRALGIPEGSKFVDRMPTPAPSDTVNIPGVGRMKRPEPKLSPSGAMLLKKGGKACK